MVVVGAVVVVVMVVVVVVADMVEEVAVGAPTGVAEDRVMAGIRGTFPMGRGTMTRGLVPGDRGTVIRGTVLHAVGPGNASDHITGQ